MRPKSNRTEQELAIETLATEANVRLKERTLMTCRSERERYVQECLRVIQCTHLYVLIRVANNVIRKIERRSISATQVQETLCAAACMAQFNIRNMQAKIHEFAGVEFAAEVDERCSAVQKLWDSMREKMYVALQDPAALTQAGKFLDQARGAVLAANALHWHKAHAGANGTGLFAVPSAAEDGSGDEDCAEYDSALVHGVIESLYASSSK